MDPWKRFHNEFMALMEEEDRIVRQRDLGDWFQGHVIYGESGEFGSWSLANSATESLQARFELLATEAGIALGSPPGTLPRVYWLHRLFADLRANNSQHIRIYDIANGTGGIIERLLEASATFCSRLDRRSLEKAVMSFEDPRFEPRPEDLRTKINAGELSETGGEPNPAPPAHDDLDFTSDQGRSTAVNRYAKHWACPEAALARAAAVDTADLSKWKKGRLPAGSEKRARIERALVNSEKPVLAKRLEFEP
jgi:hypothetical protein